MITQLIVWSPQLAGLIAEPGFTAQGRMSWGPMPVAAPALGWAVMVIVWPGAGLPWRTPRPGRAGRGDEQPAARRRDGHGGGGQRPAET